MKKPLTPHMREIAVHLSWSAFGGVSGGLMLLALQTVVGRILGPVEFGKATLSLTLAAIMATPMIFGLDLGVTRSIARSFNGIERRQLAAVALTAAFGFLLLAGVLLWFAREFLARWLATTSGVVQAALFLAIFLGLRNVLDGVARGWKLFSWQAVGRLIEPMAAALALAVLYHWGGPPNYRYYVLALAVGFGVAIGYYFVRLRDYFLWPHHWRNYLGRLFHYSKYVAFGSVLSLVVLQVDKLLVNARLGEEALGIYMAYFLTSVVTMSQLSIITVNVLFPLFARQKNVRFILRKLDRLFLWGLLPIWLFLVILLFVVLRLFGPSYPESPILITLFSLWGVLFFFSALYAAQVNSYSHATYRRGVIFQAIRAAGLFAYFWVLVQSGLLSLAAVALGLVVNYALDIVTLREILRQVRATSQNIPETTTLG